MEEELEEQEKDLRAFESAFKTLERRCFEAQNSKYQPILDWQGADAALFVLSTCMDKIHGIVTEYRDVLLRIDNGEIENQDWPRLKIVEKGDD